MATKVFVSPGVYTSEKELSFVAQSVGITTLGIAGETLKGPAFEPIFIRNYDEFVTYFGETNPQKFVNTQIPKYEAAYIAKAYLQQSNQLFVTRILGLSGYDAGPSWSFKTIGQVNFSTMIYDTSGSYNAAYEEFSFTATTGANASTVIVDYTSGTQGYPLPLSINIPFNTPAGVSTTVAEQIQQLIQSEANEYGTNGSIAVPDYYVFGPVSTGLYGWTIIGANNYTNVFGLTDLTAQTADLSSVLNTTWYNTLVQPDLSNPGSYTGLSLNVYVDGGSIVDLGGGVITGIVDVAYFTFSGASQTGWDDIVITTLRSRGVTDYSVSNGGPMYEVMTAATSVGVVCDGNLNVNPYALFTITGNTDAGQAFSYDVSMDENDSFYISRVLGVDNFEKNRLTNPLFVEETFPTLLEYGFNYGYIRGISCDLLTLPGAREFYLSNPSATSGDTLGWYLDKYQTPMTPWVVSELQGNKVTRLFRFVSISDGDAANTEIKVSILNISFINKTFDVAVRQYNDTDANPVVIEKFTNCTMDPDTPGYIAKKIGTQNGEYGLNSKYIMLEMNYEAGDLSLPCGFEGYIVREYSGTATTPPFPIYKTKYNYPGEVLYYSPVTGQPVLSLGDKVRRTYLGFCDGVRMGRPSADPDLLQYKGRQYEAICAATNPEWDYQTKGFHMDSGATVCTIGPQYVTSGQQAFDVGYGSFTSEPQEQSNPYYYLYARKFTLVFQGGYDGWNIYDEHRTNTDDFQLGRLFYMNSACPSALYAGTGYSFKQITIDANTVDWATTDYYAYLLGIRTFNNPAAVNINVFASPGLDYVNHTALATNAIDMIENDRADSIYIITTPDWEMFTSNSSDYMNFIQPQDAVDILADTGIDSNYTSTYYPWVLTRDNVNNTQIYIPPTAEVTRNLALTDNIAFPWFATAGYTRGIVNAVKARKKVTQEDRDTLYTGRINPIATFADVGTVIWGNKTLQIAEGALNRVNVRRLLLQARKLISAVAIRLLFEQNDAKVRQDFLDAVNPILDAIRRDRGLYDFRVTVSNSPEDFDRQQLVGKIYIKPTKALEFIDIEFLITPTGASFENI